MGKSGQGSWTRLAPSPVPSATTVKAPLSKALHYQLFHWSCLVAKTGCIIQFTGVRIYLSLQQPFSQIVAVNINVFIVNLPGYIRVQRTVKTNNILGKCRWAMLPSAQIWTDKWDKSDWDSISIYKECKCNQKILCIIGIYIVHLVPFLKIYQALKTSLCSAIYCSRYTHAHTHSWG